MKHRQLDANGDWVFGKSRQSFFYDADAILQNIVTRLNCFVNDCFFDMTAGVDWVYFLSTKGTEADFISATKSVIAASYGVVSVNSVDITKNGRAATISYNVDTIFTENAKQTVEVGSVS